MGSGIAKFMNLDFLNTKRYVQEVSCKINAWEIGQNSEIEKQMIDKGVINLIDGEYCFGTAQPYFGRRMSFIKDSIVRDFGGELICNGFGMLKGAIVDGKEFSITVTNGKGIKYDDAPENVKKRFDMFFKNISEKAQKGDFFILDDYQGVKLINGFRFNKEYKFIQDDEYGKFGSTMQAYFGDEFNEAFEHLRLAGRIEDRDSFWTRRNDSGMEFCKKGEGAVIFNVHRGLDGEIKEIYDVKVINSQDLSENYIIKDRDGNILDKDEVFKEVQENLAKQKDKEDTIELE